MSRKAPPVDVASLVPKRRVLPKLIACLTKQSLENLRNKALFSIDALDAKGVRRRQLPLYKCLVLELKEAGYSESSNYLQDLLYDNAQLVEEDDIGILVDLRKRDDYLEHIASRFQAAERERERNETKKECMVFVNLANIYAEKGRGILWLAEKFYLAAMAVSSRYLLDGGRLKSVTKYYYAKFLLDKFPGADTDEPRQILTEIRDASIGKDWLLHEPSKEETGDTSVLLFRATAIQLHRVLLQKARQIRKQDTPRAERLSRLAERRGQDARDQPRVAEAIVEVGICQLMMNNLNNAKKTFQRAFVLNTQHKNIEGLCDTRMHLAAVMQRLGDHEMAAQLLTEMGALAMEHNLRRHLGRALHLLGELHLRRERPELGTQHLTEAFYCFMGSMSTDGGDKPRFHVESSLESDESASPLGMIYSKEKTETYREEAEQSRFMTAISAGQELMASYFQLLRHCRVCTVDMVKGIEWKLARKGWWENKSHHDEVPCPCPDHDRTPLDVVWAKLEQQKMHEVSKSKSQGQSIMKVEDLNFDDVRKITSEDQVETEKKEEKAEEEKKEGEEKPQ